MSDFKWTLNHVNSIATDWYCFFNWYFSFWYWGCFCWALCVCFTERLTIQIQHIIMTFMTSAARYKSYYDHELGKQRWCTCWRSVDKRKRPCPRDMEVFEPCGEENEKRNWCCDFGYQPPDNGIFGKLFNYGRWAVIKLSWCLILHFLFRT